MAIELLLAVKAATAPFDAVAITPWWLTIRRGGPPSLEEVSLAAVGSDPLGVLETHRIQHPTASRLGS